MAGRYPSGAGNATGMTVRPGGAPDAENGGALAGLKKRSRDMILCIPVEKAEKEASRLHGHFGSAENFLLYDTDKDAFEPIENKNVHHDHGQCHPMESLSGRSIGAVLCLGMGRRALEKLNAGGVRVLVAEAQTAGEAIQAYREGKLIELDIDSACGGHAHHGA